MHWDDGNGLLTIKARRGSFPEMVKDRNFRTVLVRGGHGVGGEVSNAADADVAYEGREIQVKVREASKGAQQR